MKSPRQANEYRNAIIQYSERSYTKTIFQGFIYRFLQELLKQDETDLDKQFPDLDEHVLAHLSVFDYIRGNAYLGDSTFSIEQDISITIESDGEGWTDVGSRDLSHSSDFHWFLSHLKACAKTGARWIILVPSALLSIDSELQHPLPSLAPGPINPNIITPNSLIQSASHLPREFHLLLDHAIAALDPLYALSPIFRFAAATSNQVLSTMTRRYEIISSALWDIDRAVTHLNQLITHKHLLSDHACRHEEVLRYLQSTHTIQWSRNLTLAQARVANQTKSAVEADFAFLAARFKETAEHHQNAIAMLTSATALAESRKQIQLATQVTKLTVLASVFLPLSFVTGLFGMNFV
ncbi:hypothetical protein SNOG_10136 [Parastagonospora nodorum SN15]|uniref:Uncharacterized protein n=1 Tax=Phaeosphaeria nodorum (strain SN15 / ATCC MYA-4574 / FGSC 10173) TaxID=321614 RepID=Q0UDM8_PHANO|nr:hypothetical protein SNOG_10136 [Parastagonospora nodorum SN15]EAT82471.2 hypothetical protein SNOG_10136 [Parastagonospora nodorum SN15]